jgi:hypothetical protein
VESFAAFQFEKIALYKKVIEVIDFPIPSEISLTKLSRPRIIKLFPPRESLVSDIPVGDGIIAYHLLQCRSRISISCSDLGNVRGKARYRNGIPVFQPGSP